MELWVEAPVGNVIGFVRQECSPWAPKFGVYDAEHNQLAEIGGPCCICNGPCCGDVEFPVSMRGGVRVSGEHAWLRELPGSKPLYP